MNSEFCYAFACNSMFSSRADRFLSMLGRAITTSSDYHVIYYFLNSLTTIDAIDAKLSNPDNYKKATEKKDEVFFDMDNVRADYSYAITHIGHGEIKKMKLVN